jgi:hypothetical protein
VGGNADAISDGEVDSRQRSDLVGGMNGNNFLNYLRNCRCKAAQKVIEDSGGDVAKGASDAIMGAGGAVKGIFKRLGK